MSSNIPESNLKDSKVNSLEVQNYSDSIINNYNKPTDNDDSNVSSRCKEVFQKAGAKKVKIVDPKSQVEVESDEDDSLSQQTPDDRIEGNLTNNIISESTNTTNASEQSNFANSVVPVDRKKTKEERKKEREKKKEEEMLKKYQAEQEAKQKISAKSKCGRWIKHNLKVFVVCF